MAKEWALGAGAIFVIATLVRTLAVGKTWRSCIPGGISVAVGKLYLPLSISALPLLIRDLGMYNVPSFTLARLLGGLLGWYWVHVGKRSNTPLIIMASVSLNFT